MANEFTKYEVGVVKDEGTKISRLVAAYGSNGWNDGILGAPPSFASCQDAIDWQCEAVIEKAYLDAHADGLAMREATKKQW